MLVKPRICGENGRSMHAEEPPPPPLRCLPCLMSSEEFLQDQFCDGSLSILWLKPRESLSKGMRGIGNHLVEYGYTLVKQGHAEKKKKKTMRRFSPTVHVSRLVTAFHRVRPGIKDLWRSCNNARFKMLQFSARFSTQHKLRITNRFVSNRETPKWWLSVWFPGKPTPTRATSKTRNPNLKMT